MAIVAPYHTTYGKAKIRKKQFYLEYRQITQQYELRENDYKGKIIGKFFHSDFALLAVVKELTGYESDELSPKHRTLMNQIEKGFGIKYQGLIKDDE